MSWPLSQDYNEAIQSPARNFTDADLQRGTAVANAFGLPMPYSGNFADVYQMQRPDGSRWAVKCFTRETPGLRERYAEISRHLRQAKLPFTVDFNYLEQGIRVAGQWFPALKMQWVEGLSLNQFVARAADKPTTLEALLQVWVRMAGYLRAAEVAHCDLQHGNVLLVPGAGASSLALKLVDYDGTRVPALAGHQSGEVGHPSYQHPARAREGTYGPEVDRFSLLLVATALRALMTGGRALWEKYDNGDNLLFTEADLQAPAKSRLFLDLIRSADPLAASLAKQLIDALRAGVESAPLLEELLPESRPAATAVSPRVTRPAAPEPADLPVAPVAVETERRPSRSVGAAPLIHPPGRTKARRQPVPVAVWIGVVAGIVVLAGAVGAIYFVLREGQGDGAATGAAIVENRPGADTGSRGRPAPPTGRAPPVPKKPAPVKPSDSRPAVPDDDALAAAEKEVREAHKAEYADTTRAGMAKLAALLHNEGLGTNERPALRFVLLRKARDLAARGGDLGTALGTAQDLANSFAVDALDQKATAIETAGRAAVGLDEHAKIAELALGLVDDADLADHYEAEERFAKAAQASTSHLPDNPAAAAARSRVAEAVFHRESYEAVQDAVTVHASKPADPAANLALGRFHALVRGDWDRGAALLVRGSDAKLKALAQADRSGPATAAAAVKLAADYEAQAASEDKSAKANFLSRAYYWYGQALAQLPESDRAPIQRKRAAIEKSLPAQRPIVLAATWGAYKGWADVTHKIRWFVAQARGQELAFRRADNDLGIRDPAFGEYKSLVIVYRYRGGVHVSITGDLDTTRIPAPAESLDSAPGSPAGNQQLAILYARYGNEAKYADITTATQEAVRGPALVARPEPLCLSDPYPFRHKSFIIVYREGGRVRLSVSAQEDTVRLGAGALQP